MNTRAVTGALLLFSLPMLAQAQAAAQPDRSSFDASSNTGTAGLNEAIRSSNAATPSSSMRQEQTQNAQQAPDQTQAQASSMPSAPMPQGKGKVVAAVSFGYFYLRSQAASGDWSNLSEGFYGIPQVNVNKWFGFNGDFTTSYNTGAGVHENVHAYLGGLIFTAMSEKKISPFAFVDGGDVRDSKNGRVLVSPALATGFGFNYKMTKRVGLLFIPAEYVRTYPDDGPNLNNYTARVGLVLPLKVWPKR